MSTHRWLRQSLYLINIMSFFFGSRAILNGIHRYWVKQFDDTKVNESEVNLLKDHLTIFYSEYIIICTFIFLVSIFGFISAATKNIFYLKIYAAMSVMLIGSLIITTLIGLSRFEDASTKCIEQFIAVNFNDDKYNERKLMIDGLQQALKCCGNTGKENYAQAEFLPSSCCSNNDCFSGIIYNGCKTKIHRLMNIYREPIFEYQKMWFIQIAVIAGVIEAIQATISLSIVHFNKSKVNLQEKKQSSYTGNSGKILPSSSEISCFSECSCMF